MTLNEPKYLQMILNDSKWPQNSRKFRIPIKISRLKFKFQCWDYLFKVDLNFLLLSFQLLPKSKKVLSSCVSSLARENACANLIKMTGEFAFSNINIFTKHFFYFEKGASSTQARDWFFWEGPRKLKLLSSKK